MRRSSYSGLRTIRGFLHANPVSFVDELTSVIIPTDLSTTFTFSRIFIRVDDRSPAMACFVGTEARSSGETHRFSPTDQLTTTVMGRASSSPADVLTIKRCP